MKRLLISILAMMLIVNLVITITANNQFLTLGVGGAGTAGGGAPAVPGLVQITSLSNTRNFPFATTVNSCPTNKYCGFLPNATQSGNAIIGCVTYSESPSATITITDDQSNTYSIIDTADDTTNTKKVAMFAALNVAANTRAITVASNVASQEVAMMAAEFYNIATSSAADVHNVGTSGSGSSTMASGSITPSQTGELLFQCGRRTQTKAGTFTAGSQSNITWKLGTTDNIDGLVAQWGIYSSTSAISPQLTMGSNSGYATVSTGFKTATSGSARPSGMQIINITHYNYIPGDLSGASVTVQFPSLGNLIVVSSGMGGSADSCTHSATSDSATNSYSGLNVLGDTNSGRSNIFYAGNATTSNTLTVTFTITGGDANCDGTFLVYDIIGAATSPFVQSTGYLDPDEPNVSTYTLYNAPLAPGVDSGISIWNHIQATSTTQSMSSPCTTVDITMFGGETIDGGTDHAPDENQGWGHCNFSASTTGLYTLGFANSTLSSAAYHVAFFKSSTASPAALIDDPFTRSNAALVAAASAGLYAIENGKVGFDINTNAVKPNTFAIDDGNLWIGNTVSADQWATCTIGAISGSGSFSGIGVALRESSGAHTLYRIIINANNGTNTYIDAFNAGSNRTLSSANSGFVWAAGDVLYAQVQTVAGDQVIKVRKGSGGSDIISKTDNVGANEITSGNPGLTYSSSITNGTCASWTAGAL
jgi:hypothetical protein